MTQPEAIIEAFKALGGSRNKNEIDAWVRAKYGAMWKDFGTCMADMVALSHGGNRSSNVHGCLFLVSQLKSNKNR